MTLKDFFIAIGTPNSNIDLYSKKISEVFQATSNAWMAVQDKLSKLDWERIKRALSQMEFIIKLESIDFPPCIHLNQEDVRQINRLFSESIDKQKIINSIINKYDSNTIYLILNEWEKWLVGENELILLLYEAVNNYLSGRYYSCTALLVCQYGDSINKNDKILKQIAVSNDNIKERIEWLKDEQIKIIKEKSNNDINEKSILNTERNRIYRHLEIYRNIETLFFLHYFDKFIYGIEYLGNHPNRNKICHGVKKDFGTQETALKAILCIDIIFRCPEMFRISSQP